MTQITHEVNCSNPIACFRHGKCHTQRDIKLRNHVPGHAFQTVIFMIHKNVIESGVVFSIHEKVDVE